MTAGNCGRNLLIVLLIGTGAAVEARLPPKATNVLPPSQSIPAPWSIDEIVPRGYNRLIPPRPGIGEPVNVLINLNITQILSIKEDEQSLTVHCHYSQRWKDPRIKIPQGSVSETLGLDNSWKSKIWVPDTYFHNAIEGKGINILAAPYNFILANDSQITMTLRTVLTLTCDMNLRLFPHDSQVCDIIFISLSNRKRDVIFEWENFELIQQVDFPKFNIEKTEAGDCDVSHRPGYYCLRASIHLKRRWEYYAIRIYGPSLLLVVTTFIGFWIPVFGYPARVLIIVTPLLSLVTQQTQINAEINVSYVVALHVWMLACTFFCFMALLELAFAVVYAHGLDDRKQKDLEIANQVAAATDEKGRRKSSGEIIRHDVSHFIKKLLDNVYGHVDWTKAPLDRNKVDYCARMLFPACLIIFICIYTAVLNHEISAAAQ